MKTSARTWILGVGLAVVWPTLAPASVTPGHGVCTTTVWTGVPLGELARTDPGWAAYCEHLLAGAAGLRRHDPALALAAFVSAERTAVAIASPARRLAGIDEARAGQALAMEAAGRVPDAVSLLAAPGRAQPDPLHLTRAYLYARHGLRREAREALVAARRTLPRRLWCDSDQAALQALETGAPVAARSLDVLYLPSFLRPCDIGSVRGRTPTERVASPRSMQIHFPLGDDRPYAQGEGGRLNRAALASIAELVAPSGETPGTRWTLTGHTDQSCPRGCIGQCCAQYNLDLGKRRAAGVRTRVHAMLGTGAGHELGVETRGFSQPIVAPAPGSRGVAEANRRVELNLLDERAAPVAARGCPWVVRVFEPGRALDDPNTGRAAMPNAPPMAVAATARYELVFSGDPARWRHLYVFNEAPGRQFSDLLEVGGLQSSAAGELIEKGRRLPARRTSDRELTYYLFDGHEGLEVIHAFAATESVPALERFRARINTTLGASPAPITRVHVKEAPWRSLPALASRPRFALRSGLLASDAPSEPLDPSALGSLRGVSDFAGGWGERPRIDTGATRTATSVQAQVQREVTALDQHVIRLLATPPRTDASVVRCEFRLAAR